jgi:ribosomal protein S18 acetylase RimI-like enzyme
MSQPHPLDNTVHASLSGPHSHFAERCGRALRYPAEMSPFVALPARPDGSDWAALADLAGPGSIISLKDISAEPPPGWEVRTRIPGVQLVGTGVAAEPDLDAVRLVASDVPEMLDLVKRTKPGPFALRTIEMGCYLGIRRRGELVAMAGERLHPPGWTEISAVCTDTAYRGQGLATRLIRAVVAGIRDRGEKPFLHVAAANDGAIRLYEALGFQLRRHTEFLVARTPTGT